MKFSSAYALMALLSLVSFVHADPWAQIACNATSPCPESKPCCSQYGFCGTGSYCLGGCDPRHSFNLTACMPQPRMDSFTESFSNTNHIKKYTEYLGNASDVDWVYTGYIANYDNALLLQMPKDSTGTVVSSTKYFWYGKVGATMKSSRDRGVITAFITFSDVQDEIDYEMLGYNLTFPQNNYYSKGMLNYTNTGSSQESDTFQNWHYYEIDWQEDRIIWSIDGREVRTLEKKLTWNATSNRFDFPATPSRVQFSLWPGGSSLNGLGTIEWAGGEINWDSEDINTHGYYYAYVKNVSVTTYGLPSYFKTDGLDLKKYNAFLYNSTDGNSDNIYLTNKKTWLGSDDASGLKPDNDSDNNVKTSALVISSGLSLSTSTTVQTRATSARDPSQNMNTNGVTTTASYVGGFVQNNQGSGPLHSSSMSSGGRSSTRYGVVSALAAVCAAAGGIFFGAL